MNLFTFIRVKIRDLFTTKQEKKDHQLLWDDVQRLSLTISKMTETEEANAELVSFATQLLPEFERFYNFIESRARPEDFGDDMQPIPDLALTKMAIQNFKFQSGGLKPQDSVHDYVIALYIEQNQMPHSVVYQAIRTAELYMAAYSARDGEGNITVETFDRFLQNEMLLVHMTDRLKSSRQKEAGLQSVVGSPDADCTCKGQAPA